MKSARWCSALLIALVVSACAAVRPPVVTPPQPPPPFGVNVTLIDKATNQYPDGGATAVADGQSPRETWIGPAGLRWSFTEAAFNICAKREGWSEACAPVAEAVEQDITLTIERLVPRLPTRAEVFDYKGRLADVWDSSGQVIWGSALPGAPEAKRKEWLKLQAAGGATHIAVGPFDAGESYPGVGWNNPDLTRDFVRLRAFLMEILETPTPSGHGMVPVIFLDSGGRNPIPRLQVFMPTLSAALTGIGENVITVPCGWEPIPGDWRSAECSWALRTWKPMSQGSVIAWHGGQGRPVGSSNCNPANTARCTPHDPQNLSKGGYEDDDPWRGDEAGFYQRHGGEFVDMVLFQTIFVRTMQEALCGRTVPKNGGLAYPEDCAYNRWDDTVARMGAGLCTDDIGNASPCGWRKMAKVVMFETTAYGNFRGITSAAVSVEVARRGRTICLRYGVVCGFGNGLPD